MLFARQFKPKINNASAEYMVEEYKKLRQRDSTGVYACVCASMRVGLWLCVQVRKDVCMHTSVNLKMLHNKI